MRKYTLYQAARHSKISRYKLEQAIKEGLIKTIPGKGNIKCFIFEDELKNFLEKHGDQFIKHEYPDDKKYYISPEIADFVSKEIHEKMLNEKERIIQLLESQNEKFLPLIANSDKVRSQVENEYTQKVNKLNTLLDQALTLIPPAKTSEKESIQRQMSVLWTSQ